MTEDRKQNKLLLLISTGLVIATIIAYEPIRHNGFVRLDDFQYITRNSNIIGGITLQSVAREFSSTHMGNWHPLTMLSHMLDYQLFGLNPFGHHLVSTTVHIINVLLLFWILSSITEATWASAFVAGVFALHPLQVESVAWASERKTVISGLFWFLTIAVYIWYTKKPGIWRYIVVFAIYGLSIMTKPVVVTLPLVLILLDYWPLERIKGLKTEDRGLLKATPGRLIVEKIPLLVLSVILSVITVIAQRNVSALISSESSPLNCRVANMFLSYIKYIGKMLWPHPLVFYYPYPSVNLSTTTVIVCAALFILLSVIVIYAGRHRKYAVMGWLWYVGTLVPMIGLVQVGLQGMADRYMYLPMIGLTIIIAWGVKEFVGGRPVWKAGVSILTAVILLSAIVVTRTQVRTWKNSMSLFEHALKFTKNNHVAESGYGIELTAAGRLDEAELHFKNSIRILPNYYPGLLGLSKVYLKQNKPGEALKYLTDILWRKKDSAEVYYCFGIALNLQNKHDDAIKWFAKALELDPKHFRARDEMGVTLMKTGKVDKAILCFKESLQIRPNQPEIYMMLGSIYEQAGDYKSAITNWSGAVELSPDNANALNSLAWLLATSGEVSAEDANKAIELAERACELTGYRNAMILDTLAAAYATAGRFEEAVTMANKAIEAARAAGQKDIIGAIQDHLELFKKGQPYRQK